VIIAYKKNITPTATEDLPVHGTPR